MYQRFSSPSRQENVKTLSARGLHRFVNKEVAAADAGAASGQQNDVEKPGAMNPLDPRHLDIGGGRGSGKEGRWQF